jgi:WD40 repeat protein
MFSPDDRLLAWARAPAAAGAGGEAIVWDIEAGKVRHRLRGHIGAVMGLAFHPDGDRLATGDEDGTVTLWDVGTGRQVLALPGRKPVGGLAFSPNGRHLARGLPDGGIEVLDATPLP